MNATDTGCKALRVVIADDEPLARQKLKQYIDAVAPLELVGEARDGLAAKALIERLEPDIAFLDIRMPGLDGPSLVRELAFKPTIVFTTAYDQFAVTAYELGVVDYLLKPFGRERFMQAMERLLSRYPKLRKDVGHSGLGNQASSGEALFVRHGGQLIRLLVSEIVRIESLGDYMEIRLSSERFVIHGALKDMQQSLKGHGFVRVHRSHLVNTSQLAEVRSIEGGRKEVLMANKDRVIASRSGSRALLAALSAERMETPTQGINPEEARQ